MKKIKYKYITKESVRKIFWIGSIQGGLIWAIFSWLSTPFNNPLYVGLSNFGLVILAGTIGFCGGMLVKLKE